MAIVVKTAPELRAFSVPLEVRSGSDARTIRARVVSYDHEYDSKFRETFAPGVFGTTLERNADKILLFREHDWAAGAIGVPVAWQDSQSELVGEWRFASTSAASEALEMAEQGLFGGVSVGFKPPSSGSGQVWNSDFTHVRWESARLCEVSLVSIPALEDAEILSMRSAGVPFKTPRLDAARAMLAAIRSASM